VTLDVATFLLAELGLSSMDWEDWFPKPRLPPWDDPHKVTRYTDATLQPLRQRGDRATEGLILKIAASAPAGTPVEDFVHRFFERLIEDRLLTPGKFNFLRPDVYRDLLHWAAHTVVLPKDLDRDRIARASSFFKNHIFAIGVVLSTSSLLEAYACRRGAAVLSYTGLLSEHTNRRLYQTLQFVLDVTSVERFENGETIRAIQKVRLMHGTIRWLVRHNQEKKWNEPDCGCPINREDLLGTLMCFSTMMYRDLPRLLIPVSYEEADDYRYLWNVVGKLLGVEASFLPNSVGEALALTMVIERRQQQEESVDGIKLTAALITYHRTFLRRWVDSVGVLVMRWLVGDAVCDKLHVPAFSFGSGISPFETLAAVRDWGIALWAPDEKTIKSLGVKPYSMPRSIQSLWKRLDDEAVGWYQS
jgi:hypothetical protein